MCGRQTVCTLTKHQLRLFFCNAQRGNDIIPFHKYYLRFFCVIRTTGRMYRWTTPTHRPLDRDACIVVHSSASARYRVALNGIYTIHTQNLYHDCCSFQCVRRFLYLSTLLQFLVCFVCLFFIHNYFRFYISFTYRWLTGFLSVPRRDRIKFRFVCFTCSGRFVGIGHSHISTV